MGAMRTFLLLVCVGIACLGVADALKENGVQFCCAAVIEGNGVNAVGKQCVVAASGYTGTGGNDENDPSSDLAKCIASYKTGKAPPNLKTGGFIMHATCAADGSTCVPVSGANGDPHLVGLDGTHYILWGKPDTTYNLLSERHHQVNIRLFHPAGHPDNHALYIQSVGLLIHSARMTIALARPDPKADAHLVLTVGSGPSATAITYAGRPMERAVDSLTSYAFRSPQKVIISSRDIVLSVIVSEGYYIDVMVDEVAAYWSDVHGVLGQTHERAFKLKYNYARGTAVGELPQDIMREKQNRSYNIKGKEDDYITSGLLSADDKFTRYVADEAVPVSRKLFTQAEVERVRTMGAVLGA